MEQKSNDGDDGKKSESSSKSDSSGEEEKDADIQTSSDKRKLEAKEQKYFTGEGASKVSLSLSPSKRKCIEIHNVTSGKIEHCEKQSKADEAKSGVLKTGTTQMTTKRSPTIFDASAASDDTMQGSPKRLATMTGTSAGVATQVSPKRSQSILPGNALTPLLNQQLSKFSSSFRSLSSSASVKMQGFPKHLRTIPGTFTADEMETASKHSPTIPATSAVVKQGSPKRSPKMPEAPNTGTKQGSPKRSPKMPEAPNTGTKQGSPKRSPTTAGTSTAAERQESTTHSPMMPITSTGLMQGSPKRSPKMPEAPNASTKQGSPKRSPTTHGASTTGVMQGSPKFSSARSRTSTTAVRQDSPTHSPTMPVTSTGLMQASPKRSPMIPGTSATGFVMQGSPTRSPTKRTYKERQQSCNVDDLVEKRLKEESGYRSDSALDLRKDFKKQMPCSTQSPDVDCQPGSSEIEKISKKLPEEKHTAQSNFPRDPKPVFSEVTSSDGGEADVSSTSNENVTSSTGREASSAQRRIQNVAEANKTRSPSTSPQHSGARPKESAGGSRSLDFVQVSFPVFSPSTHFYREPDIRIVSPPRAGPSGSGSDGYFKVPPPPPPFEERATPQPAVAAGNALGALHSLIELAFVMVTDRLLSEQVKEEEKMKAKKRREEAELFERRKQQARETSKKLREKEARLKEGGDESGIVWDPAVAGPSTSRAGTTEHRVEENVEVEASGDGQDKEPKSSEPLAGSGSSAAPHQSSQDENANFMEGGTSGTICEDVKAKKSEPFAVQANLEGMQDESKQSKSGVAAERLGETTASPEHVSLQQLVPQIDEISLNDSLENVEIADSEQEDENVDFQST